MSDPVNELLERYYRRLVEEADDDVDSGSLSEDEEDERSRRPQ